MSESAEKAQLYILISGKYYHVERILFEVGERIQSATGWKLTHYLDEHKHGPYCVIRQPSGRITCECADFMLVKQRTSGEPCKHILACKQIGLFQ